MNEIVGWLVGSFVGFSLLADKSQFNGISHLRADCRKCRVFYRERESFRKSTQIELE
jgi:hypothetical protein